LRNLLLDQYATADIDQFVGKVLSDLGNPDPPLKLAEVRELLRLGKAFYSSTHDSAIREVAHKLKVAGQPVLARPTILKDIIGKLGLKALLLPDRRRILIDSEVPGQKQRWSEAHQIGHDVIPRHADTMLGDNKSTLRYQNTITTTLWRYVELNPGLAVGAISGHPHRPAVDFSPRNPLRYFIRSRAFSGRFSGVTEADIYAGIQTYCDDRAGGLLGRGEVRLFDNSGQSHVFQFETFFNRYEALTLGSYLRPSHAAVPV